MGIKTFTLAVVLAAPAAAAEKPADLVLAGGVVITLDPARPRASAVAIRDGRIVAVGDEAQVEPFVGPATKRIDLAGRAVVPGLTDAHVHVESLGESLETLSLAGVSSLDEALERIRAAAAALPPGEWLRGRGWDHTRWPGQQFPTAAA